MEQNQVPHTAAKLETLRSIGQCIGGIVKEIPIAVNPNTSLVIGRNRKDT